MKRKNIIICTFCALVILMAIGYAAFVAFLNINGTAAISSNWDVHLDSIEYGDIVGNAKDLPYDETINPDGTRIDNLSATFKTELVSPGDSITYSIVVINEGTIDAKLDSINVIKTENDAILYSVSGLAKDDILGAGDSKPLTITVSYDNHITAQPDILSSSLTVTLNFVQA